MFSRDSSSTTCSLPLPFGFKSPLILEVAIIWLEPHFSQKSYELFLLVFPPQPDNPHCQVQFSFHLKRCPRLVRKMDISLVYSSSFEPQSYLKHLTSVYPTFVVYLTTIHRRLSFLLATEVISWIIQYFQRTYSILFLL